MKNKLVISVLKILSIIQVILIILQIKLISLNILDLFFPVWLMTFFILGYLGRIRNAKGKKEHEGGGNRNSNGGRVQFPKEQLKN